MVQLTALLQPLFAWISSRLTTEKGQTFAEYALIFALVVIVAMAGLTPLGTAILNEFNAVVAGF